MKEDVYTRVTTPGELDAVLAFYRECGYTGGATLHDTVVGAIDATTGAIAGVLRLCPEGGTLVLRGVYVHPMWRGRKVVGRALLAAAVPLIGSRTCWCVPFRHLENFYTSIGFKPDTGIMTPQFLLDRLAGYRARGLDMIIMICNPSH